MANFQRTGHNSLAVASVLPEDHQISSASDISQISSLPNAGSNNLSQHSCNLDTFYNITDCVLVVCAVIIMISLLVVLILVSYIIYFRCFYTWYNYKYSSTMYNFLLNTAYLHILPNCNNLNICYYHYTTSKVRKKNYVYGYGCRFNYFKDAF